MTQLEKATLQEISSDASAKELGPPVPVQFNPTTLKLKISNRIEGGRTRGRQVRQYVGSSSTSLTLELVFDSADEGTTEKPRSVREKTAIVEKFVLPKKKGKWVPPKLRFHWNQLTIEGIVENVDLDFDLFAADGTPLRAKVGLTINQQDPTFQFPVPSQAAAGVSAGALGEAASAVPGSAPAKNRPQSAPALAGETAAEFAARVGLDPAAWRGLEADLSAGLALEAGVEVGFDPSVGATTGLGVHMGVQSGVNLSLEATLGLAVDAAPGAGYGPPSGGGTPGDRASGLALAAAGGVGAALQTVQQAKALAAARATREAFAPTAVAAQPKELTTQPMPPQQERTPLVVSGPRSPSQQASVLPAPLPSQVDQRAISYGFGVPLKPQVDGATRERQGSAQGSAPLKPKTGEGGLRFRDDPTTAPWVALPVRGPDRARADAIQDERRRRPCGAGPVAKKRGAS